MDINIRDVSFRIERPDGTLGDIRCDDKKGKRVPLPERGKWLVVPVANAGQILRRDAMNQKLLEDALSRYRLFWTIEEPQVWVAHDGKNRLRVFDKGPRFAEAVIALPCRPHENPHTLGIQGPIAAWEIDGSTMTQWGFHTGTWVRGTVVHVRWQRHARRPCATMGNKRNEDGSCANPGGPWVGAAIRCYHAWSVAQRGFLSLLGCDECAHGRERGEQPAWPRALHFKPTPSRLAIQRQADDERWYDYPDVDDYDRSEGPVVANEELP